jgi:peroxidase
MHSKCVPIIISRNDPFYSPKGIGCMDFIRSNVISNKLNQMELGEQVNAVTSFLDLSFIYGSTHTRMRKVRSHNGGRLRTNPNNILPTHNGRYFTGDDRATQSPFLTVFHTLFIRHHNHIADKLGAINRHWSDEKLFQESRKINIAFYQKVMYEEWLPLILGSENAETLKSVKYNVNVDASTINEFSNGAFRFFHALLPSEFELRDRHMKVETMALSDAIIQDEKIACFDNFIRGMLYQNMSADGYSEELLNKMFKNANGTGLDLLSMDILRARDHGIPAYYKFRRFCNIKPYALNVFNDLESLLSKFAITQLRQTYKTIHDIDLLIGGILERVKAEDDAAIVGPTFECIMNRQFHNWKAGDAYFYTHDGVFTTGNY